MTPDLDFSEGSRKAVLLAGGKGSRLGPYTTVLPKPLLPIGDRAILELVVHQLPEHGFTELTFAVGYLAHLIHAVFGDGKRSAGNIGYHHEDQPLGTAGALAGIQNLDETFLMMHGDVITTLGCSSRVSAETRLKQFPCEPRSATLGCSVKPPSRAVSGPVAKGAQPVEQTLGLAPCLFYRAPGLGQLRACPVGLPARPFELRAQLSSLLDGLLEHRDALAQRGELGARLGLRVGPPRLRRFELSAERLDRRVLGLDQLPSLAELGTELLRAGVAHPPT